MVWQQLAADLIVPDLDLLGVLEAALVQSQQLERRSKTMLFTSIIKQCDGQSVFLRGYYFNDTLIILAPLTP